MKVRLGKQPPTLPPQGDEAPGQEERRLQFPQLWVSSDSGAQLSGLEWVYLPQKGKDDLDPYICCALQFAEG